MRESRIGVSRVFGEIGMENQLLMGTECQFRRMKKFWRWMVVILPLSNVTGLYTSRWLHGNCLLGIVYHNKKRKKCRIKISQKLKITIISPRQWLIATVRIIAN